MAGAGQVEQDLYRADLETESDNHGSCKHGRVTS